MGDKLSSEQWPAEWVLVALVLASVLGYLGWTMMPLVAQNLLLDLGIICILFVVLILVISTIWAMAKEREDILCNWQHFAEQENLAFQLHPWQSRWSIFEGQRVCECAIQGVYQQRTLIIERLKVYQGRYTDYPTQGSITIQNPTGIHFCIKGRGFSSLLVNLWRTTKATIEQRELDTRFVFEGQPSGNVTQILQNRQLRKLLLDPLWISRTSIIGTKVSLEGEKLTFQMPACNTEDELGTLLSSIYTLAPIIEQEIAIDR